MKRFFLPAIIAALLLVIVAGCTSAPGAQVQNTSATPTLAAQTTVLSPTPTVQVSIPVPVSTPFPDSVSPGTVVSWQNGNIPLEATMTRAVVVKNYSWYSQSWGTWYPVEAPEGKEYLFVFIKYVNKGNEISRIPSAGMVDLVSNGTTYRYASKRVATRADEVSKGDVSTQVRANGRNLFEEDYGDTSGEISILAGESNAYEGFLIYVVPESIDISHTYLKNRLSSTTTGVWSLN